MDDRIGGQQQVKTTNVPPPPSAPPVPPRMGASDRGICGTMLPALFNGPLSVCVLLAEHKGWHQSDTGTTWGHAESVEEAYARGRRDVAENIATRLEAEAPRQRGTSWDSLRRAADIAREVGRG